MTASPAIVAGGGPTVTRAPRTFRELRVLIAHDWLVAWAGSERCVAEMLNVFPKADLLVGVRSEAMRTRNDITRRARESWLGRLPGARRHYQWYLPLEGLAFASFDTSKYDLVLSSSHAFAKMIRARGDAVHVSYCHSPPRYLWDLNDQYLESAGHVRRLALAAATKPLKKLDRWSARGVHRFIANSRFVAERIGRCYDREADVVHPPVAIKTAARVDLPRERFLLSLGRLVPYKRIDLAIAAAERLGVRLIVAGNGSERQRLERLAGPMTTFVGEVSESTAGQLLSTCSALVFCAEEDFGITPVEANAHGAPVVGFGKGGLAETMIPDVTAQLFEQQTVESVADAIDRALSRPWDAAPLRENARRFSPEHFRRGLASAVRVALERSA